MVELTISNLIKMIIGIFVVAVVVIGLYLFFKNYVIDFFKNMLGSEPPQIILNLLKWTQKKLKFLSMQTL